MTELNDQNHIIQFLNDKKNLQCCILEYIESKEDSYEDFEALKRQLNQLDFNTNHEELFDILLLISKIINNHYRPSDFFDKIKQILLYLNQKTNNITVNEEILLFYLFKDQKQFLILLFRTKLLTLKKTNQNDNQNLLNIILNEKDKQRMKIIYLLYPEIKSYLSKIEQNKIITSFLKFYEKIDSNIVKFNNYQEFESNFDIYENYLKLFQEKCFSGENDSYICKLIRNDLVEDFISYVNKNNISFRSIIVPNIFESNSFLKEQEEVSLIEYATFFGSIQIFNFLRFSGIELTSSLWLYAIHGKNPDIIHILEENRILPKDKSYRSCFVESIKCHHNDIAIYIQDNLLKYEKYDNIFLNTFNYYNFAFFPEDFKLNENKEILSVYDLITSSFMSMRVNNHKSMPKLEEIINSKFHNYGIFNSLFLTQILSPDSMISLIFFGKFNFVPYKFLYSCDYVTHITLPFCVESIHDFAFYKCTSLKEIVIPSSVVSINNHAFEECTSLERIIIPSSMKMIGCSAFHNCTSLTHLIIPSSVEKIGNYDLKICKFIEQIKIPLYKMTFMTEFFMTTSNNKCKYIISEVYNIFKKRLPEISIKLFEAILHELKVIRYELLFSKELDTFRTNFYNFWIMENMCREHYLLQIQIYRDLQDRAEFFSKLNKE